MPHIAETQRDGIDSAVEELVVALYAVNAKRPKDGGSEADILTAMAGPLNYAITRLLLRVCGPPRYWKFVIVAGTLQKVMAEYDRLCVAPYEDQKILENGNAYW